jgi:hypothetical protein
MKETRRRRTKKKKRRSKSLTKVTLSTLSVNDIPYDIMASTDPVSPGSTLELLLEEISLLLKPLGSPGEHR